MPYLYRDADHMWKVLNGEIGQFFLDSMSDKGFVGLVYYDSGARSFYNTKKPIYTVADLKGMKIRVQESTLMMGLVQALGAVPTPMSYGDVYSALQTGVIDGAENNWPSYDSSSHYEVAKFYSVDQHTRVPEMIIASKISMDKLSADDQAIIKKAAKESQAVEVAAWAEYEKKSEAKVRAAGCQINNINDQAEFASAMAPLYQSQLNAEQQAWVAKIKAVK
jgi:tripartite ATP-independent transporter DctP family solute receptor